MSVSTSLNLLFVCCCFFWCFLGSFLCLGSFFVFLFFLFVFVLGNFVFLGEFLFLFYVLLFLFGNAHVRLGEANISDGGHQLVSKFRGGVNGKCFQIGQASRSGGLGDGGGK